MMMKSSFILWAGCLWKILRGEVLFTGMSKLPNLKKVLSKAGIRGMTVIQVLGCGIEKGTRVRTGDEGMDAL